jgi:NADPH:quinone reductase
MKAIAIKAFVKQYADLHVSDVAAPTPKAAEILVTITHAGVNHVDLLYARGAHQNNASRLVKPPFVLGLEFAGIVAAVPSRTGSGEGPPSRFHVGDRVWGSAMGAFAEQIAVPESSLQRVPEGWSLEDVAWLGAATAPVSYGALVNVANVQSGEVVLVHAAAGGLGVVAAQIARALGGAGRCDGGECGKGRRSEAAAGPGCRCHCSLR